MLSQLHFSLFFLSFSSPRAVASRIALPQCNMTRSVDSFFSVTITPTSGRASWRERGESEVIEWLAVVVQSGDGCVNAAFRSFPRYSLSLSLSLSVSLSLSLSLSLPIKLSSPKTGHLAGSQPWALHFQSEGAQAGKREVEKEEEEEALTFRASLRRRRCHRRPKKLQKPQPRSAPSLHFKKKNRTFAATSTTSPASATAPRAPWPTPDTPPSARTARQGASTSS